MKAQNSIMVLDLVDSGIIMLDKQGRIAFWNKFISQSSHIEFTSIENKQWLDVFPSLVNSRINKAVDKAINLNFPSILSYKLLRTQFPLYRKSLATKPPYLIVQSIVVKPVIENGKNNGCVIYINDVSAASMREEDLTRQSGELKQALKDYDNAKNQFEQLFKSAYAGIIVFDEQGLVDSANDSASNIFDLSHEAILGVNIADILPRITQYYSKTQQCYSLDGVDDFVFNEEIHQSQKKYLTASINRISEHENKYFVYVSDVTTQKNIEERLLSANSELEEFAYRTSHDLRSPLVSSIGLLGVARSSLQDKDFDKVEQCFDFAEKSLKKLEVLVRDILSLTEAKNTKEPSQEINLNDMLKDTFDGINQLAGFEKIDCRIKLEHSQPLVSDKKRVNMIIENLLSNAVKYYDPDKPDPYIEIQSKCENEQFILTVSDNGLGIPPAQKDKLFKMFNRFHPKVAFGSGLGLYLMKKSAEVIGGDIEYVDQPQGAQFQLVIPQVPEENRLH